MASIEAFEGAVSAASAFVVAVFTGTLWWSTRKLFKATKDAADRSDRTVSLYERPWLFINISPNILPMNYEVEPFLWFRSQYTVSNHGRTPAIIQGVYEGFSTGTTPETPLQRARPFPGALGTKEDYVCEVDFPDGIEATEEKPPRPKIPEKEDMFLWLRVEYIDIAAVQHVTSDCFRFDMVDRQFVRFNDGPPYNLRT